MTKTQIEEYVENFHKRNEIKSIPVQVEKLVEDLGLMLRRAPSEDFSGLLLRKNGTAVIGINSDESYVRQRFSIAHELGHYFLHESKDVFVDYRDNKTNIVRTPKEKEANTFAAALLMPRSKIINDAKKVFKNNSVCEEDIEKLAKKYEVSKDAMTYRLLNIGTSFRL